MAPVVVCPAADRILRETTDEGLRDVTAWTALQTMYDATLRTMCDTALLTMYDTTIQTMR